ncbi:ovochymase-2 [Pieris rapae]|uniref:ovochymase-2 n=1 Tax=Pieris rapae TaxID=64459 RepID=UPI001E27B507|nr:ovochymase-2 [Pieris rapae]
MIMAFSESLTFLFLISAVVAQTTARKPNFNVRNTRRECTLADGRSGICVDYSYCKKEGEKIERGGIIHISEFRSGGSCKAGFNWCCIESNMTKPPEVMNKEECFARDGDYCPWCVSLYRGDAKNKNAAELFCAGVLVGSKVVLTTATCHIVSVYQDIWAKIPGSAEPRNMYSVAYRKQHENYNSGTHAYDLAIFTLDEEVKWNDKRKVACLALTSSFKPVCISFGYDSKDRFVSTIVEITKGSCIPGAGETVDVSCGKTIDDEPCFVATGAPVICEEEPNKMTVYGIARSPCRKSAAQLGAINLSSQWLADNLKGFGLSEENYLLKKSTY